MAVSAAQNWNRTQIFPGLEVLEPLKIDEYDRVPNWDGLPLFWRNRKIVRPFASENIKMIIPYAAVRGQKSLVLSFTETGAHRVEIVCRPIFNIDISMLVGGKDESKKCGA